MFGRKWLKTWDSDLASMKDVHAKISLCITMMYEEINISALRGKMQIMPHCQDPSFELSNDIILSDDDQDFPYVYGMHIEKFPSMNSKQFVNPCMINFDELQDLVVSRIIDLVRGIIEGPMAAMTKQHLCCFSQRCNEIVSMWA